MKPTKPAYVFMIAILLVSLSAVVSFAELPDNLPDDLPDDAIYYPAGTPGLNGDYEHISYTSADGSIDIYYRSADDSGAVWEKGNQNDDSDAYNFFTGITGGTEITPTEPEPEPENDGSASSNTAGEEQKPLLASLETFDDCIDHYSPGECSGKPRMREVPSDVTDGDEDDYLEGLRNERDRCSEESCSEDEIAEIDARISAYMNRKQGAVSIAENFDCESDGCTDSDDTRYQRDNNGNLVGGNTLYLNNGDGTVTPVPFSDVMSGSDFNCADGICSDGDGFGYVLTEDGTILGPGGEFSFDEDGNRILVTDAETEEDLQEKYDLALDAILGEMSAEELNDLNDRVPSEVLNNYKIRRSYLDKSWIESVNAWTGIAKTLTPFWEPEYPWRDGYLEAKQSFIKNHPAGGWFLYGQDAISSICYNQQWGLLNDLTEGLWAGLGGVGGAGTGDSDNAAHCPSAVCIYMTAERIDFGEERPPAPEGQDDYGRYLYKFEITVVPPSCENFRKDAADEYVLDDQGNKICEDWWEFDVNLYDNDGSATYLDGAHVRFGSTFGKHGTQALFEYSDNAYDMLELAFTKGTPRDHLTGYRGSGNSIKVRIHDKSGTYDPVNTGGGSGGNGGSSGGSGGDSGSGPDGQTGTGEQNDI